MKMPHSTRMSRSPAIWLRALACLAAALVVFQGAGCSKNTPSSDGREATSSTGSGDDEAGTASGQDPCSLLEVAEVEAAVGKLAGLPYRQGQNGPEAGGNDCMYEIEGGRTLKLGVVWDGAPAIFKMFSIPNAAAAKAGMKGKLPLPDGATFEGEWDEAKTIGCCQLDAMLGDRMVDLEFAATHLDMKQAATLVNAGLKRLEKPLALDGNTGVAAALAREKKKPQPRSVCALLSADDVTPILGPQAKAPEGSESSCTYAFTQVGQDGKSRTYPLDLKVSWRGGYRDLREQATMAGQIMGSLTGNAAGGGKTPEAIAGPWEDAAATLHFMAVKKDVLMSVDLRVAPQPIAQQLVAKAMEKI